LILLNMRIIEKAKTDPSYIGYERAETTIAAAVGKDLGNLRNKYEWSIKRTDWAKRVLSGAEYS